MKPGAPEAFVRAQVARLTGVGLEEADATTEEADGEDAASTPATPDGA